MRQVASFEDERIARRFADVLCARQVETDVSKSREGEFIVWVLEEKELEAARVLWTAFVANPDAPEYLAAEGCVDKKQQAVTREERRSRHEVIDAGNRWRSPSGRRPFVTFTLIAVSVLVALGTSLGKRMDAVDLLLIDAGRGPVAFYSVAHGQPWRLLTPIFLHFGILHIFFNMWWLLDLGSVLELRLGSARFFGIVFATALVSNVAQYLWAQSPLFGGMSGVLYALFAYTWVRARFDPTFGLVLAPNVIVILFICLALGFVGAFGPSANATHVAGLISGALLGMAAARGATR